MGIAPGFRGWRRKHKAKTTMLCRAPGQGEVVSRLEAGGDTFNAFLGLYIYF